MAIPNLIIAGVNKAGTTSIFDNLAAHPEIFSSDIKETCYFLNTRYGDPDLPLDVYESHFKKYTGKERYVMEATPGYFYGGKDIALRIKDLCGSDVKIIICLREPSDRALSFFKFMKSIMSIGKDVTLSEY